MIIQRLDLKAYGRFTDVSLDLSAGPRRFHLVYGPNESGKTTSLRAITSLLFGMQHRTDDNYVHNNTQLRVGGLLVAADGSALECVRRRGRKATLRDADDNEPIEESLLSSMLGGIDRETFLTRFGLSHQELVEGGAAIIAGEGDLGEILFAAGAGVSRLREIQAQLIESREKLFVPRGSRAINQSIKELEEQRKELRQIQIQPSEFIDLRDRLRRKRAEAEDLQWASQQSAVQLARLHAYQQSLPLLPKWRSTQQELAPLFDAPLLDDAFSERRREAESQREIADKLRESLSDRITELTRQVESLPVDSTVLDHASEIESVFQELAARDKADRDRVELIRVRRNLDRKLLDLLDELSVHVTPEELESSDAVDEAILRLRVSDAMRARIHELASHHQRVIQQRDDASERLKTLQRKLADVNVQLDDLGTPADPAALSAVIDEIGSPASLLDSLEQQTAICKRIQEQCDDHLRNLEGFDGNCKAAIRLQIPEQSVIERIAADMSEADKIARRLKAELVSFGQQRDQLNRSLVADRQNEPLPTAEDLKESRRVRDLSLAALSKQPPQESSVELLERLRDQILAADNMVDTIRTHHARVHQREVDQQKLASIDQQIADLEKNVESAIQRFDTASEQWESIWRACGIRPAAAERMQRWIHEHEKLLDRFNQWELEEQRREQIGQRVVRAAKRLRSALESVAAARAVTVGSGYTQAGLFDPPPTSESLASLYDDAVTLRGELLGRRQEYDTLRRRRDEWSEELSVVRTRLESCQRAVDQWQDDWRRVTEPFAAENRTRPSVVVSLLSRIDELCSKKRERDILCSRIKSIGEDDDTYARRVDRLAAAIKLDVQQRGEPGAIARMMYARLQGERSGAGKRASLCSEIEQAKLRLAESISQRDQSDIVLGQLCIEAGAKSANQLPEIERRSRQRLRLEASLRDLENQLSLLAGDEVIDKFVDAARQQNPALLIEQIREEESQLDHLRQRLSDAQQEIGALGHEMNLFNGSGRAAELHQSIQFLLGKLDRDADQYARLRIASLIMRRAIDHYRRENQNPVLAIAEQMFRRLTCGEYQSLKVDYDAKGKSILVGERCRVDGSSVVDVPVSLMSVGTADALYLALRLASLQHQLSHGQAVPLVIDDCLIQLDDDRAAAALQLFSELSESTQVILFTHHQHLLDLASAHLNPDDFHVHRL